MANMKSLPPGNPKILAQVLHALSFIDVISHFTNLKFMGVILRLGLAPNHRHRILIRGPWSLVPQLEDVVGLHMLFMSVSATKKLPKHWVSNLRYNDTDYEVSIYVNDEVHS